MASPVGLAADVSQVIELNQDIRTGMEQAGVYESRASVVARRPTILFGTTQLASYLDLVGAWARCINSDGTHPGFDAYQLAHDRCSHRDLTNSDRYRVGDGLILTDSISVNHQGRAEVSGRVVAITDSSGNEPVVKDTGVTYPNTAVDDEEFGLYTCTVGGDDLTGLKNIVIEPGVEVTQEDADGSIFPEWASVGAILTRIRLQGVSPAWLGSSVIPIAGKSIDHADTTLRFVKYASGSSYDTLTNAVHIGITVAGMGCITTAANSSGRGVSTTEAMIYALHDGTNVPLIIDTTFALA
jgi:hypothetical protein